MENEKKNNLAKIAYALSLAFQLGFIIAIPLVVFCFIGIAVDKKFNTQPNMFIISLVVGLYLGVYSAYKWIIPIIKK